jgi:tripartite-type tricarboxylate transporter receptor subunit TctC
MSRWRPGLVVSAALVVIACSGSPFSGRDTPPAGRATEVRGRPTATPTPHRAIPIPALTPEHQQSAEAFFKNRTLRIIVGSGAGGGFDTTARLVARHFGRYVPGKPLVIVENMPGGGGMVAANHMYNVAEKDGLVIGIFQEVQVLNQLTGAEGVQFDLRQFSWLGSSYDDPNVCVVRTNAPFSSFKDMIGSPKPFIVGGTGPGSNSYDVPRVLAAATGANIKAVAGYPTTNDVRIGIERGELHGICFGWESVRSAMGHWLQDRYAKVVVQNGIARHPDRPDVPSAIEFAKDETSKTLLRLVEAPGAIAKPFALPPGVDPVRVQVLRAALLATYQDPEFLREAAAMNLDFRPKTAAEIQQILDEVLSAAPDVVARMKEIVAP